MNWVYLFIAIISEVIATSALKTSENFTKLWPSIGVIIGYGVAFFFLSLTLKTIPVGVAYAIWSGVGIVLVSAVGWIAFKQALDAPALIGMAMIIAGCAVINLFSQSSAH